MYKFIWVIVIVLVLWIGSWVGIIYGFDEWETCGQFGDMFGAINSLFSGLAFAGAIIAIYLQSQELNLQRKELEQTRDVFKEQSQTMSVQRFENTFFNMLGLLAQIQESLAYNKVTCHIEQSGFIGQISEKFAKYEVNKKGREVFSYFKEQLLIKLQQANNGVDYESPINDFLFGKAFNAYAQLGNYFENIYTILEFIDNSADISDTDKSRYVRILRAQLSNDELFLLICNIAYRGRGSKIKKLFEKYSMFASYSKAEEEIENKVENRIIENFDNKAFNEIS